MMTTKERAKIFMPFDAMKGLSEALREKEEMRLRVDRRILSDEESAAVNDALNSITKGMAVCVTYYNQCHEAKRYGVVKSIDYAYKFVIVNNEKILFDDVYAIEEQKDE